jgi:hypothetical protein
MLFYKPEKSVANSFFSLPGAFAAKPRRRFVGNWPAYIALAAGEFYWSGILPKNIEKRPASSGEKTFSPVEAQGGLSFFFRLSEPRFA